MIIARQRAGTKFRGPQFKGDSQEEILAFYPFGALKSCVLHTVLTLCMKFFMPSARRQFCHTSEKVTEEMPA